MATGIESWDVLAEFASEVSRGERKGWKEWGTVVEGDGVTRCWGGAAWIVCRRKV
jgi:hypothetical protein